MSITLWNFSSLWYRSSVVEAVEAVAEGVAVADQALLQVVAPAAVLLQVNLLAVAAVRPRLLSRQVPIQGLRKVQHLNQATRPVLTLTTAQSSRPRPPIAQRPLSQPIAAITHMEASTGTTTTSTRRSSSSTTTTCTTTITSTIIPTSIILPVWASHTSLWYCFLWFWSLP